MDNSPNHSRFAAGRVAGTVGILANGLLFATKLAVGILSGSVSVTADAMNNLSDASSSVVTILGFKLSEKPADEDHPYGHARFEYLSALAVAVLIIFIGFELAKTSIGKIIAPTDISLGWLSMGILLLAIGVKLGLWIYYGRLGRKIQSDVLLASAVDSRNDVIATCAVLLSSILQNTLGWKLDGFTGLAVAVFILYSGITLAKTTVSPLLGEAAGPELREMILDEIRSTPKVLGYHDLMVHDYGPGRRFASIHVEMDSREDPLACHEIIDSLERECFQSHGIHLVIHYDPVVTDDPKLKEVKDLLTVCMAQVDERLSFHDLRIVERSGYTELVLDVILPANWDGRDLPEQLESRLSTHGSYKTTITLDLQ